MVFLVLQRRIIPFPLAENQAAVVARVWSGRLVLPTQMEMKAWEKSATAEKGAGQSFHLLPFPLDAAYMNLLYDWAEAATPNPELGLGDGGKGKMGSRWGAREKWVRQSIPEVRKAFVSRAEQRHFIRHAEELGFNADNS
jgi:hypothetical protein